MRIPGLFQSLRTQLIVIFMLISLLVLSGSTYVIYNFMLNLIKEQNESLLQQQFQQLDHNINAIISEVDRLSKLFVLDDDLQQFIQTVPEKNVLEFLEYKNKLHAAIAELIGNYSYIHSIYLTAKDQGAIGGSASTTLVHTKEDWTQNFYTSNIYQRSLEAFPKLVVEGGIRQSFYNPYLSSSSRETLISMFRGIRPIYESHTNVTVIFNIDERYLASIYSASLDRTDGEMYIVNETGMIISSSNSERVGGESPYLPSEEAAVYGSYDFIRDGTPVQIVYYKLQATGWYLMKEIPLIQFSDQIFSVQRLMIAVFVLSLIVIFIVSYFWLKKMIRPLHLLSNKMKDMSRGELGVTVPDIPSNELGIMIRRFNEMSMSIVELIEKNNEMQEKKRELEIEALQYQINPHFLYNTLNMIRWMASIIKADNIVNSIVALGNILRPIFTSKDTMCTLEDELSYLENYMKIINWRFNNRIYFAFDAQEIDMNCLIPRFILQPLVENSIASGNRGGGVIHIRIHVYEEGEDLWIAVTDNGPGFDPAQLQEWSRILAEGQDPSHANKGSGVGLYNVNKRIQLYFGQRYGLKIIPIEGGAEVRILLPKQLDS